MRHRRNRGLFFWLMRKATRAAVPMGEVDSDTGTITPYFPGAIRSPIPQTPQMVKARREAWTKPRHPNRI
jgi:hypothetical protein